MLATEPALAGETGGYYRSGRRRAKPLDFDPELSRGLWQRSLELCAIAEPRIR